MMQPRLMLGTHPYELCSWICLKPANVAALACGPADRLTVVFLSRPQIDYKVGTMIEVPRAALLAGQIAESAEFFSFGTNGAHS